MICFCWKEVLPALHSAALYAIKRALIMVKLIITSSLFLMLHLVSYAHAAARQSQEGAEEDRDRLPSAIKGLVLASSPRTPTAELEEEKENSSTRAMVPPAMPPHVSPQALKINGLSSSLRAAAMGSAATASRRDEKVREWSLVYGYTDELAFLWEERQRILKTLPASLAIQVEPLFAKQTSIYDPIIITSEQLLLLISEPSFHCLAETIIVMRFAGEHLDFSTRRQIEALFKNLKVFQILAVAGAA